MGVGKIYVFGDKATGKTELFNRLSRSGKAFSDVYKPTIGADFRSAGENGTTLQIWDNIDLASPYCIDAFALRTDLALYCIDLSKPLNEEKIQADLDNFRKMNSFETPIVLVGTKSDCNNRLISDEEFNAAIKTHNFIKGITVSSKTNHNIDNLLKELFRIVNKILNREALETATEESSTPTLTEIVQTLQSNIVDKKNRRFSCFTANQQSKLDKLWSINLWLEQRQEVLKEDEELAVLAIIRDVCAVKRNPIGFFSPHSLDEFEALTKKRKMPDCINLTEAQLNNLSTVEAISELISVLTKQLENPNVYVGQKITIEDIKNLIPSSVSLNFTNL